MRQWNFWQRAQVRRDLRSRVIIASIPRCGSTLLLRALAGLPPDSTFPKTRNAAFVRDLRELPTRQFLKTHSLAPPSLPLDVRPVFLFGDPVRAVVSTMNKRFDNNHFLNCGYCGNEPPRIYERDDLGYERIFDSWMRPHDFPVLAVRYEAMFEHQDAIANFVGFPVTFPRQRRRATQVPSGLQRKLSSVYASLIKKVQEAPDVQVLGTRPTGERKQCGSE